MKNPSGLMNISIPARYVEYFEMLVQAEVYSDLETALLRAFRLGVNDCLDDAFDLESGEPAMDLELLSGEPATVQVKDISDETHRQLRAVAHLFSISADRAASVVLLLGLCHHYLELKASAMFEKDERFREKVRDLPHEMDEDIDEWGSEYGIYPDTDTEED